MPQIAGKDVGPIGYGMMNLTAAYVPTPVPQEQAIAAMREALNQGSNFWNAGEFYGSPERNSLHLLNEYFTKYPEDASKVFLSVKGSFKRGEMVVDGSKAGVTRSIEECLRILDGKKKIDLFQPARIDPAVPYEDTISYVAEFVKAGKIGSVGISEPNVANIRKAASVCEIAAVEVELSLWSTDIFQNGIFDVCQELKLPIIGYGVLGKGFLTGQIKSYEDLERTAPVLTHFPRFQRDVFDENLKLVHEIEGVAQKKGCTSGQVAIAWVTAQSEKGVPVIALPGASSAKRVAENCKAVDLTKDELETIDAILKNFEIKGERYPAHMMAQVRAEG